MQPHDPLHPDVADHNVERLIEASYKPEVPDPAFVRQLEDLLCATAQANTPSKVPAKVLPIRPSAPGTSRRRLGWSLALAASIAVAVAGWYLFGRTQPQPTPQPPENHLFALPTNVKLGEATTGLTPRARPPAPKVAPVRVGDWLTTKAGERRRVTLDDGSVLYLNQNTQAQYTAARELAMNTGEIYVEVSPREQNSEAATFTVKTNQRTFSALGTRFAVNASANNSGVVVTQGKVKVSDLDSVVLAGQQLQPGSAKVTPAPRASHQLDWTRELMAAADSPLVPCSQHAGGALVAIDPHGQEMRLTLRKYKIDVHLEDGFARTTIDQTYFNNEWARLEGVFYFPLPPDATLSRLAMYVEDGATCRLMEGGMAERDHARQVFETIMHTQRDPALLEWVDGSTFKMRVFPLEGRKEKRIILSYTQKVSSLYGAVTYRFPGGHNMELVKDWEFAGRIKLGGQLRVTSESHPKMSITPKDGDMVLSLKEKLVKPNQDVTVEVYGQQEANLQDAALFSAFKKDDVTYLMLRYRPRLESALQRERRDWVILYEASANRDPLLARAQIEVLRSLLGNAEHEDTFTLLTAGTRVHTFAKEAKKVTPENIAAAVKYLEGTHLIGAMDLGHALSTLEPILKTAKNPYLLHVGAGIGAIGERREDVLAQRIPDGVRYVGVGVGKRWSRSFMKMAADRTGGYFTQINPDEPIAWRAFELLSTLSTPRLMELRVIDNTEKVTFLSDATSLAQGEEVCAVARIDDKTEKVPETITVSGKLDGKAFVRELPVRGLVLNASYLSRAWAKLEIDRLMADDAQKHKKRITELSMASYVMSPFTSLLVLETDADYQRFNVDRGRKDHWAMYQCEERVPIVFEPPPHQVQAPKPENKRAAHEVMQTILIRTPPQFLVTPSRPQHGQHAVTAWAWYYGTYAMSLHRGDKDVKDKKMNDKIGEEMTWGSEQTGQQAWKALETERLRRHGFIDPDNMLPNNMLPTDLSFRQNGGKSDPRSTSAPEGRLGFGNDFGRPWGGTSTEGGRGFGGPGFPMGDVAFGRGGGFGPGKMGSGSGGMPGPGLGLSRDFDINAIQGIPPGERRSNGRTRGFEFQGFDPPDDMNKPRDMAEKFGLDDLAGLRFDTFDRESKGGDGKARAQRGDAKFSTKELWSMEDMTARLMQGRTMQRSLLYERPSFTGDNRIFGDLASYAPGLNSTMADIQAVLEAEAKADRHSAPGTIDAAARKLIESARQAGWHTLKVPAVGKQSAYKVQFNGQGHYAYERTLTSGLRETVICDGQALWHLYPEIGLASKRPVSRFHRADFAEFVPWVSPAADDLARGADVKSLDASTVAIVPRGAKTAKDDKGKPLSYLEVHLHFDANGNLSERRQVEMPAQKTLYRETYADGVVQLHNVIDKKLVSEQKFTLAPAAAPRMRPSLDKLVVLSLPIRSRDHIWQTGINASKWAGHYRELDEEAAIALLAADCLQHNGHAALQIFGERFHSQGDRRIGFYVLLSGSGIAINPAQRYQWHQSVGMFDVASEHPDSPLALYLAFHHDLLHKGNQATELGDIGGAKDGFVQRLATFRDLYLHWQLGRPSRMSADQQKVERRRSLDFAKNSWSPHFAWAMLDVMRGHGGDEEFRKAIAEGYRETGDAAGLFYAARYEHARGLLHLGNKHAEARKLFTELYTDTLKAGRLPLIDSDFRRAWEDKQEHVAEWSNLIRQTAVTLKKDQGHAAVLSLAWQAHQLGDQLLSNELFGAALAVPQSAPERNRIALAGIDYLLQTNQFARADALLQTLLKDEKLADRASLWRLGAALASRRGLTGRAVSYLEKAMDLEFRNMPEVINLQTVRSDYGMLLGHYHQLAVAVTMLDTEPSKDFLAKVVRAADRWRALDPEATIACQSAARILQTLGAKDLAWDYLTTPIGMRPNEAAPWVSLAQTLRNEAEYDLADRAYAEAFESERTNAQILWDRAQNLQQSGKFEQARAVYRQLADGTWQPRFQWMAQQARAQLSHQ
jgi:ferric-dicitrate binding protein FerR (iron transport regulator)